LDEIDIEYLSLGSELVTKEIKNGRIPLIIDGFDELLAKVSGESSTDDAFEEVESMLDTIGGLLEFKTKIILTTRKTAIFTVLEFESWLNKWNNKFIITGQLGVVGIPLVAKFKVLQQFVHVVAVGLIFLH
jgi:hypothetical protein